VHSGYEKWPVLVNIYINQLLKEGDQLIQIGDGVRCWAQVPDAGADDWGLLRPQVTFLFPK